MLVHVQQRRVWAAAAAAAGAIWCNLVQLVAK